MEQAHDTVAILEHQMLIADTAYHHMVQLADSYRVYALRVRCELEQASRKLYQYRGIGRRNPWATIGQAHLHIPEDTKLSYLFSASVSSDGGFVFLLSEQSAY
jgi:hypothetical protein